MQKKKKSNTKSNYDYKHKFKIEINKNDLRGGYDKWETERIFRVKSEVLYTENWWQKLIRLFTGIKLGKYEYELEEKESK